MVARVVTLLVAIVVAVAGAGLVWLYVEQADERAVAAAEGTPIYLVTAPEGIRAGTPIEEVFVPSVADPRKVSTGAQVAGAIAPGTSLDALAGYVTVRDLAPKEQLDPSDFVETAVAADTYAVAPGNRPDFVTMDPVQRLQGLVTSNSRVSLYLNQAAGAEGGGCSRLLLADVRVVTTVDLPQDEDPATGAARALPANTVVVEVTQAESDVIRTAELVGGGTFSLAILDPDNPPSPNTGCLALDDALEAASAPSSGAPSGSPSSSPTTVPVEAEAATP